MDTATTLKLSLAIITLGVSITCTYFQLKNNQGYLINKLFAGFMILVSLGFLSYTIYHFIEDNITLVIGLNILSNILYNYAFAFLAITPFVLLFSEKNKIVREISILVLFLSTLTLFSYIIWPIQIDEEKLQQHVISIISPIPLLIIMSLFKVIIISFVLYQYIKISKNSEGRTQQKMKYFVFSMISIIIALLIIILSTLMGNLGEYFEVIGTVFLNLASIFIARALISRKNTPE